MGANVLLLCSVLPVSIILLYIYKQDKENKEPLGKLLVVFLSGCFCVVPAIVMEAVLMGVSPVRGGLLGSLYDGFVVAGFSEELCKLGMLMIFVWRSPHFDEYFDGIVYAVYVSMGFACVENIGYVFGGETFEACFHTSLWRAVLSVPAHFLFAVSMGYFFSLAKFDPKGRAKHMRNALLVPLALHGTFDALLMYMGETVYLGIVLLVVFVVFDIRMWKKGLSRIREMQQMRQQEGFDSENPFANFKWKF